MNRKSESKNSAGGTSNGKGSILGKIAGISSLFMLAAVAGLLIISIFNMRTISLETAVSMAERKIEGDISTLHYMIEKEYGALNLVQGRLIDGEFNPLDGRFELVDEIKDNLGVEAAIFIREGDGFKQLLTTITDDAGERAAGSALESQSPAALSIMEGDRYIGFTEINGRSFIAGYEPVFSPYNMSRIGILFVGIEFSAVHGIINDRTAAGILHILTVAAAIIVLSVIISFFIFNRIIVKPVNRVVQLLKSVSEGDLTARLELKADDEIGRMAHYFNQTIANIRGLIVSIKAEAESLSRIGGELASQMNNTAAAVHQISSNTDNVKNRVNVQAESVDHTSAIMAEITSGIGELNGDVQKQTEDIELSSAAVEEMLANIASVAGTVSNNVNNVKELAAASENGRMGLMEVFQNIQEIAKESEGLMEINQVIDNIASQTNLLSMNAAIEAAHAGEVGKGFAVVAGEIRKLAESSNEQVKTVTQVLKKIEASVNKISGSANAVIEKFGTIDTAVKTVTTQEEHVLEAMKEQNAGSKQIMDAISALQEKNRSVASGSAAMQDKSETVISESRKLENITAEINTGMDEMAAGTRKINDAVQEVNGISIQNRENIESLKTEVARFRV